MGTVEASCHCGAIRLSLAQVPEALNACQCSICRRYGAHWAYYDPADVRIVAGDGETDVYLWGRRMTEFHRCRACGCITHWLPTDRARRRMGINGRMLLPEVLATIPAHESPGPP